MFSITFLNSSTFIPASSAASSIVTRPSYSFSTNKTFKEQLKPQKKPLVIVVFLDWHYYISSPGTSNRNFIVLFHNSISSWNSSYIYGRLILSQAIYLKQCFYHTVVIIFLTVIIYISDHHWIFHVDLSRATHLFFPNWNFMVDTFIPTHQQSVMSYCHNSLSHFSLFQSADPYCHNPYTNSPC